MSAPFRYRFRVRYAECDAQKVVFNSRYGDYVDLAVIEFLRCLGFEQALVDESLNYQLVKQTTEWRAPARFNDILEVAVRATAIGNTSFTVTCDFRRAGDAALLASSETVYVQIDDNLQKTPISPELRRALEQGAVDRLVDQSSVTPRLG